MIFKNEKELRLVFSLRGVCGSSEKSLLPINIVEPAYDLDFW